MPREPFLALLEAHPEVREYFHRTFLAKYMDKAFTDMRSRSQLFGSGEKLLFTTAVGDLITHPVVTASSDISIRDAARADVAPRDQLARPRRRRHRPDRHHHRPGPARQGRRPRARHRRAGGEHHEHLPDQGGRRGLLLRGAADDAAPQHPPPARRGRGPPAGDRHQPRPADPPGDLADLRRARDRGADRPRRARAGRREGRRHRRAAAQGRRPRRQHHPHHHRDQRPARAQGDRVRAAPARAGAAALVLARLRQRGAPGADLPDRPGQRPRLRRPAHPGGGGGGARRGSPASPAS